MQREQNIRASLVHAYNKAYLGRGGWTLEEWESRDLLERMGTAPRLLREISSSLEEEIGIHLRALWPLTHEQVSMCVEGLQLVFDVAPVTEEGVSRVEDVLFTLVSRQIPHFQSKRYGPFVGPDRDPYEPHDNRWVYALVFMILVIMFLKYLFG